MALSSFDIDTFRQALLFRLFRAESFEEYFFVGKVSLCATYVHAYFV